MNMPRMTMLPNDIEDFSKEKLIQLLRILDRVITWYMYLQPEKSRDMFEVMAKAKEEI
jgi:hypothetical protein